MKVIDYSKRLGPISKKQFQNALDRFKLGQFVDAKPIRFGLFGQNVFLTSTEGKFVLRGAAYYEWQFPEERFVAKLLHDQTSVRVPWPYLVDTDESIFGWKYGYVIMPCMPGLQLADDKVLETIRPEDRKKIAYAIGENLTEIQRVSWPSAGRYDLSTNSIKPFENGFAAWTTEQLKRLLHNAATYDTGTTQTDQDWIGQIIQDAEESLRGPFAPVLVLHDYKEANLVVEKENNRWQVSGVFDLMEALFGDGELDLVRQLSAYLEDNIDLAKAFLDGYRKSSTLRPQADRRLAFYVVYDRMIVWEYFHRPEHLQTWWYDTKSFREWVTPYLEQLEQIL